jgi:hypothetical protein
VLVVEHVIPPGNDADWGMLLDINMLVLTEGGSGRRSSSRSCSRGPG